MLPVSYDLVSTDAQSLCCSVFKFSAQGLMILERNYLDVYPYDRWSTKVECVCMCVGGPCTYDSIFSFLCQVIPIYSQGSTFQPNSIEVCSLSLSLSVSPLPPSPHLSLSPSLSLSLSLSDTHLPLTHPPTCIHTPTYPQMLEGETTPPPLLQEADLISLMEKHGIGQSIDMYSTLHI